MHTVHLVGGEKGGIGKSFFVKVLVSYFRKFGQPFILYEADEVNQDIQRTYDREIGVRQVVFSKAERELRWPNELLYAAEETEVLVNLPAAVYKRIGEWFRASRLGEQLQDLGIKLYVWYLCDGDATNLRLFGESRCAIPVPHIFVQNMVRLTAQEWAERLKESAIDLSQIPHLVLERLGVEAEVIANEYLSFERFFEMDLREKRIGRIEKRIVQLFLQDTFEQISRVLGQLRQGHGGKEPAVESLQSPPAPAPAPASAGWRYRVRDYTGSYGLDQGLTFDCYDAALEYISEATGLTASECRDLLRLKRLQIMEVPA